MAKKAMQGAPNPLAALDKMNMGKESKQLEKEKKNEQPSEETSTRRKGSTKKNVKNAASSYSVKSSNSSPLEESVKRNITKYNGISETGKPIYVSEDIIAKLRGACEKYHRRVSVRALAQAMLDSLINDMNGLKFLDDYMKEIGYKEPSAEKLAYNKALADKAKERRAAEKK